MMHLIGLQRWNKSTLIAMVEIAPFCVIIASAFSLSCIGLLMQSQKAVSAYFTSKQILPFGFAEQYSRMF